MIVKKPAHPVPQLATFELDDYREQLEHAVQVTPDHTADRELLQKRLAEVLDEQQDRRQQASRGAWKDEE